VVQSSSDDFKYGVQAEFMAGAGRIRLSSMLGAGREQRLVDYGERFLTKLNVG
jgi:hypothetical protein